MMLYQRYDSLLGKHPVNVGAYSDGTYIVDVSVPGYKKENIRVRVRNGTLYVDADPAQQADDSFAYTRIGFTLDGVKTRVYVGDEYDVSSAKLTDGILRITLVEKQREDTIPVT